MKSIESELDKLIEAEKSKLEDAVMVKVKHLNNKVIEQDGPYTVPGIGAVDSVELSETSTAKEIAMAAIRATFAMRDGIKNNVWYQIEPVIDKEMRNKEA